MESTAGTTAANGDDGPAKARNKLSCVICRARKTRCDRTHPCANCVRSGVECVFPTRKRMERPKKSKNSDLINRLNRLEAIVGTVGTVGAAHDARRDVDVDMPDVKSPMAPVQSPGRPLIHPFLEGNETPPLQQGRAQGQGQLPAEPASRYLSAQFWSNLCNEVEGLKAALDQSSDADSDEDNNTASASPDTVAEQKQQQQQPFTTTQGLLAGYAYSTMGKLAHPPQVQIRHLTTVYFQNVDPIVKILHKPTVMQMASSSEPENLPKAQQALLFAMYFAAVTSLPPSTRPDDFGPGDQTLPALCKKYQVAVEEALAAADYLNSPDLECLQALTIYVACLRCHNGSRASWVLVALPMRLAQALNLHRDGDGSAFSPYEAEMRRRLYWQIVVLDVRAAEDRGTEAMIASDSYNTRLPLNLNDADFGPDSTGTLVERIGPSDTTFSRCTAQTSYIFLYVGHHATARLGGPGAAGQSEEEIIRCAQGLEQQFVVGADMSHYGSYTASMLVRLICLKLWLVMQYPVHSTTAGRLNANAAAAAAAAPRWPKVPRESMLQTAVAILELQEGFFLPSNNLGSSSPPSTSTSSSPTYAHKVAAAERFAWWGATYVQWHPLAVCLAELCVQTGRGGPVVARAWAAVERCFPRVSDTVADSRRGTLWRPIRKLYKKARKAREEAEARELEATARARGEDWQAQTQTQTPTQARTLQIAQEGFCGQRGAGFMPAGIGTGTGTGPDALSSATATPAPTTTTNTTTTTTAPPPISPVPAPQPQPQPQPPWPAPDDHVFSGGGGGGSMNYVSIMAGAATETGNQESDAIMSSWIGGGDGLLGTAGFPFPDVNFDLPLDGGMDALDWSTWNDFVNDTYAAADTTNPKRGSSHDS